MTIANQNNFAAGLLYVALGIAVAVGSARYQLGTPARMGPGFFPLGVGLALALIGIIVTLGAIAPGAESRRIGRWPIRALAILLSAVILFGLLIEPMGLVVAVPVLIGVASLAHPAFSWRAVALSILILLPFTWVLFVWLLGLQFPFLPTFLTP